ncbi:sensor histidine kinase [Montanilutibacter psychrotolerans]|nr:histidine kinase [Lysobacter psychrotolerans]
MPQAHRVDAARHAAAPPFWLPLLAGMPIGLCLMVMALPTIGHGNGFEARVFYLVAFLAWTAPLTAIQRALWERHTSWWVLAPTLLAISYVMSLINNVLGFTRSLLDGRDEWSDFRWAEMFEGLEGCWLALIAFCAIHAVIAHYAELKHEQTRRVAATALAREAELRALRYQLQPHFLFNTLNAISALVADGRGGEARHMIARLADFLRATLDGTQGHEVGLADEIALTETYLEIEKARLGDRLRLKWNIGPDVMTARVPYLLLQPLVENAIRHGIARRSEPGRLEIALQRQGDRLQLRVRNDGVGSPGNDGAATRASAASVGLRNVSERLERLYPGDHSLDARALDDGGFEVRMSIAFRTTRDAAATQALDA